jgi:hypothetical protein
VGLSDGEVNRGPATADFFDHSSLKPGKRADINLSDFERYFSNSSRERITNDT